MNPRVSVVLPVRNAAATLDRAIASIRGQTFGDWELLIIDDGSADGSNEIARGAARADPRINMIVGESRGLVTALNAGIEAARGEFIARMDADDESLPERFATQLALLTSQPEIGVASGRVEFAGDRAAGAGYALHVDWINGLVTPDDITLNRFIESPLAHPSVMFRRELVGQHGGYRDGDFPEDYELWLRWLDAGVRFAKAPQTVLRWADPPARLSRTDPRYSPEAFYRLKAEWIARDLRRRRGGTEPEQRPLFVWGAGRPTRKRAAALETHGVTIGGYIDIDTKKTTPALGGTGVPVLAAEALPPPTEAFVLGYVSSRGARELIRGALRRHGYVEGRDFLMCA